MRRTGTKHPESPAELKRLSETALRGLWTKLVTESKAGKDIADELAEPDLADVRSALFGKSQTFPYVLPTQLLAKVVDPRLDARCLQKEAEDDGESGYSPRNPGLRFDPRSLCKDVIVPWDAENGYLLGHSPEPYVSKPLRTPWLTVDTPHRRKIKSTNRTQWDAIARLLEKAERNREFAPSVLRQVLIEIFRRSRSAAIQYQVPLRISIGDARRVVAQLLSVGSGGAAAQAVAAALLEIIGQATGLWDRVETRHVNVADASSGFTADVECFHGNDRRFGCEVKDRKLTVLEIDRKLLDLRRSDLRELLLLTTKGIEGDNAGVEGVLQRHFSGNINGYIFDLIEFALPWLAVLGEERRRVFLSLIGDVLDRMKTSSAIRLRWAELLQAI